MDVILLGEIQSLIDGVNTNIANAKSVIDTINDNTKANNTASETGTLSQKLSSIISYTKTNNTASTSGNLSQKISSAISNTAATTTENSSGTLSAKLTYLINRRERFYSPSSTNLKTVTTSLQTANTPRSTTSNHESYKAYSDYTNYVYACFDGIYRIYCTGTATVVNLESASNHGASAKNNMHLEVYVNDTLVSTILVATQVASKGTSAASTKTVDVALKKADRVRFRLYAQSMYYDADENPCSADWRAGNEMYGSATDISIRGTLKEVTTIFY